MFRRLVLASLIALGLTSCAPIYTLSPAVKESARRYSDVMDDFADQALLANVLRAKDYAPMNFNDLSSITGALSLSGTLGATFPFGPYVGNRPYPTTTLGSYKDTLSPSISGSSSPVINIGTLNTQGFMMTMIQPISTTYVLSKWDSHPHELLLYLFVKSIRFPGEDDSPKGCKPVDSPTCSMRMVHRNDPDNEDDFRDFQLLMSQLVSKENNDGDVGGNVDMRALNLLDPLGEPIPAGRTYSATTPMPTPTPAGTATTPAQAPAHADLDSYPVAGIEGRTYFVRVTYVTDSGESAASDESQETLTDGRGLLVKSPPTPPVGGGRGGGAPPPPARAYNVYAGYASSAETKQTPKPIPLGTQWQPPGPKLVIGSAPPAASGTSYQVSSDYNIFQLISGLSDGQLHVGNAHCPKDILGGLHSNDLCPPEGKAPFVRFYKEYPAQVVLCLRTGPDGLFKGHHIAPMTDAEKQDRQRRSQLQSALESWQAQLADITKQKSDAQVRGAATDEFDKQIGNLQGRISQGAQSFADLTADVATEALQTDANTMKFAPSTAKPSGTGGPTGGATPAAGGPAGGGAVGGGGGGGGGNAAAGTGAMPLVTLALQPSRISAIVHTDSCTSDQIVLKQETEREFDRENAKFTHVEWRSIAEVIQYLGAIARYQDRHAHDLDEKNKFVEWGSTASPQRIFTYGKKWHPDGAGEEAGEPQDYGHSSFITTHYRAGDFRSPIRTDNDMADHSLQSLALLNELISIAKISGTLPVSQPVQVLP